MSRVFQLIQVSVFILFPFALANNNNWHLEEINHNLAQCISQLLIAERIDRIRNIRITVNTESRLERLASRDIINQMRTELQSTTTAFELLPMMAITESPYEIHTQMIFVDSSDSFRELIRVQRQGSYDLHGLRQYYYIVLTSYQEHTKVVDEILEYCLQNSIVNVNLMVENREGIVTIYTYFPFSENSCRRCSPTIYNRFAGGKLQWNRLVFPKKIKNLWLCPIRAVTWHKPPFVFLEDGNISGIDGNFLIFLSKAMNFTLDVIKSPQGLGQVLPNGTTRGAFKIITDNEGDLMVGGAICLKARRDQLASTRDYFTTSVRIIVKKPSPYTSLEILLFPFDFQTWCTFLMFIFLNLTARCLYKKIAKVLRCKGVMAMRLQIITWLLSSFIIRSSYEGSIFQFLHNQPVRRVPHTFEEALAEGYKFIAKSSYLPFFKHIPMLVDKLILTDVDLGKLFDQFDTFNGRYGLVNLDNYLVVVANDSSRYGQYVELRMPVLHHIICVYLQRFSFLTEEIDHQVQLMVNHGHMQKIYDMSVTDKLRKIKAMRGNEVHTIPLKEIIGAFEFLLVAIAVASVFLLMEFLAVRNYGCLKKVVDFFH